MQKSALSISSAAGNRSSAASPFVRPPLALAVRVPGKSPTPIVPAPRASDLPRNERRLIELFRGLTLFSKLSSRGRFSPLLEPAVESLSVFMPVESARLEGALLCKGYAPVTGGEPRRESLEQM